MKYTHTHSFKIDTMSVVFEYITFIPKNRQEFVSVQFARTVDNFDIFDTNSECRHNVISFHQRIKNNPFLKKTYDIFNISMMPIRNTRQRK